MPIKRKRKHRLSPAQHKRLAQLERPIEKMGCCDECDTYVGFNKLEEHHRYVSVQGRNKSIRINSWICEKCHDKHHPWRPDLRRLHEIICCFGRNGHDPELIQEFCEKLLVVHQMRNLVIFIHGTTLIYQPVEEYREEELEFGCVHLRSLNRDYNARQICQIPIKQIERISLRHYHP